MSSFMYYDCRCNIASYTTTNSQNSATVTHLAGLFTCPDKYYSPTTFKSRDVRRHFLITIFQRNTQLNCQSVHDSPLHCTIVAVDDLSYPHSCITTLLQLQFRLSNSCWSYLFLFLAQKAELQVDVVELPDEFSTGSLDNHCPPL